MAGKIFGRRRAGRAFRQQNSSPVRQLSCLDGAAIGPATRARPSAASIFCFRRSRSIGLVSNSSHPAASACSRAPAMACAVSAVIGMFLRRRVAFQPASRLPPIHDRQFEIHEDDVGHFRRSFCVSLLLAVRSRQHLESINEFEIALDDPQHLVAVQIRHHHVEENEVVPFFRMSSSAARPPEAVSMRS